VPDYPTPTTPKPRINLGFRRASLSSPEKKMVKLAPLTVAASNSFQRFMAVP